MLTDTVSAKQAPALAPTLDDLTVWRWEAEPYRLWSFLDMLRIGGATLLAAVRDLEHAKLALLSVEPDARERLIQALTGIAQESRRIQLRGPFILQVERFRRQIDAGLANDYLPLLADELRENLMGELSEYLFFVVPPDRRDMYLNPNDWFGVAPLARFEIGRDVRDACQCYAFAQWTATVFHSMRILEHGLRWLAGQVGHTLMGSIELDNWKNIIDQIEKQVRAMEQLPKTPQKAQDTQFCSEAALHFRLLKDAWRNYVAHAHADYDQQDATKVLVNVRDFMNHLASRP